MSRCIRRVHLISGLGKRFSNWQKLREFTGVCTMVLVVEQVFSPISYKLFLNFATSNLAIFLI